MKFHDPWLLTLLALVPAWWWWERRQARRGGLKFSSVAGAPVSVWSVFGPRLLLALRGAALAAMVVGLARPQIGRSESRMRAEGIDIVLVVDISGSMNAVDYESHGRGVTRIEAVKEVVRQFIRARPNDRIGMVVFGTHPYVASPLTLDHDWLERNLDRVRVGLVEGNTAIGAGLGAGVNRLRDSDAKSKVIVLLTDGGENVPKPPAREAAKAAKEFGVRVYTIGAGSNTGQPVPVVDEQGRLAGYLRSDLDEGLLKDIAETTGGQYFRAADTQALKRTYEQIDKLEKRAIETVKYEDWREVFAWFVWPALGCAVAAVILENTRLRTIP
jgi:Ca-activated chloride channel family protein